MISWINTKQSQLKQYVALRVREILEHTNSNEWRYLPSGLNVADETTKWPRSATTTNQKWLNGPDFLSNEEVSWRQVVPEPSTDSLKEIVLLLHDSHPTFEIVDPQRFSSWKRLIRSVARGLRSISRFKGLSKSSSVLNSDELKFAENLLFKQSQNELFPTAIAVLQKSGNNFNVDKRSELYKKCFYLDNNGVIMMRSRIDLAPDVRCENPNHSLQENLQHKTNSHGVSLQISSQLR